MSVKYSQIADNVSNATSWTLFPAAWWFVWPRIPMLKTRLVPLYSSISNAPLEIAQFRCEHVSTSGRLECPKASGRSVHEQFWRVFDGFLHSAASRVLQNSSLTTADAQDIFAKLTDLRSVLRLNGHNSGNWLSTIRNEITYRHQHKAWFPYGRSRADCNQLFVLQRKWRLEPDAIRLRSPNGGTDAELFVVACAFLVSLSVAVVKDMALRCPSGESFLVRGPLKLLNHASE